METMIEAGRTRPVDKTYDVLVIGGGPAGSVAAFLAARRGFTVGLVDKAAFPRDKPCGDGIAPGAVSLLNDIGLAEVFAGEVPIRQIDIRGDASARLHADLPPIKGTHVMGYVVPRIEFDHRLHAQAIAAGADDLSGYEFLETTAHNNRRLVKLKNRLGVLTAETALLVGADGAYSRVRRALNVPKAAISRSGIAMRAYAKTDLFDPGGHVGPRLMIDFGEELVPGYGWVFPTGRGVVNVGVGVSILDLKKRNLDLRELLDRYVRLNESRGITLGELYDRKSHQLPQIGTMPRLAHHRAVLLGDAASMINPVSGEGIYYGIQAATYLVRTLPSSLDSPDLDQRLRRFERAFKRAHWLHFRSTQVAYLMLRYRKWASIVLRAARNDPVVLQDAIALLFGADRIKISTTARILWSGWRGVNTS